MKSVIKPIRFPDDFNKAVESLIAMEKKTITQLVRAGLIMTWRYHFESWFTEKRMNELIAEYHHQEKKTMPVIGPDGQIVPESERTVIAEQEEG